jgi:hypothetical protein
MAKVRRFWISSVSISWILVSGLRGAKNSKESRRQRGRGALRSF